MKIYLKSVLFILTLAFAGCDKEEKFENKLEGTWELRHIKGGQIANAPNDYPPGNGKIIKIEGNTYQRLNNGTVSSSGTFTLVKEETEIDGTKFSYKLDYDNTGGDEYAKVSGGKLILSVGSMAVDGATLTFEKL